MSSRAGRLPEHSEEVPKQAATKAEASGITLGPRDRMIGQLYVEGDLRVNGTLEGQVEATGDVDVAEAANVKASVSGREVSISGQVNGAVTASKKLVVSRSGSLIGDVRVPRLVIQDGATFSGNVSMTSAAQAPPKAASAPEPAAAPPATAEPAPPPADRPAPERPRPKRR